MFDENIDESIRDIAGESVTSSGKFFRLPDRITACIDHTRVHPFTKEQLSSISCEDPDTKIEDFLLPERLFKTTRSKSCIILNPQCGRAAHVDLGLTGDACGIAIGHLTNRGCLYYDIILRIVPPLTGDEIDIDAVVNFFRALRAYGMPFKSVTYDQYQSKQSIQQLVKAGFNAYKQSVGLPEYIELRRRINAGPESCNFYNYGQLIKELRQLEKDPEGGSPDHPIHGSKDVSDAAAGVAAAFAGINKRRRRNRTASLNAVLSVLPQMT
jgi:hypothetical protein